MKGFGIVTAAVLVVVGIGVGVVGGLTAPQIYRLPPAQTYSLNGVRFSVAFPGHLVRRNFFGPTVDGRFGTSADHHLVLDVVALPAGSSLPAFQTLIRVALAPTASCSTELARGVDLLRSASGEVCESAFERSWGNVTFDVDVLSTEGLPAAQAVAASFKLLGPST